MKKKFVPTYTILDVIQASPTNPMPLDWINFQINKIDKSFQNLLNPETFSVDDWRTITDFVNLIETFCNDMKICSDEQGLIIDCINALSKSAKQYLNGSNIKLDQNDIKYLSYILDDYKNIIQKISAREAIICHRKTEKRIFDILNGNKKIHDEIIGL